MDNTFKEKLYDLTDNYKGLGFPFIFAGADGPRIVGHHTTREPAADAKPWLDKILFEQRLSATYLSSFKTDNGRFGFVAHS